MELEELKDETKGGTKEIHWGKKTKKYSKDFLSLLR
jgi:hypothetical protein